jgi:uncharacterized RDD family membrane protein YckC
MSASTASTPSIKRRLIAMVYEVFLVLAVNALAAALWMLVTRNSHAPVAGFGLKVVLFLATGAYFVYNWTASGHTLAMKTWRMCVTRAGAGAQPYARVPLRNAVVRYLLAWGWILPAHEVNVLLGLHDKVSNGIVLAIGVLAWALTAFLDRDRQFLHDRLAGTRVVALPSRRASQAEAEPLKPAA